MHLSVYGEHSCEQVVEKSRFITFAAHTEGEEAAKAFLARVRSLHPQATHVCYAYVADAVGNEQRFSDAGEPQGTAGMPILGVLKAKKLRQTTVAVVRYFGGIKLGAGGLTRAYASSAADCCAGAEVREYDTCVRVSVRASYSEVNPLIRFAEQTGAEYEKSFGERAEFLFAVREGEYASFRAALNEFLNGRAEIAELDRFVYPFPQK